MSKRMQRVVGVDLGQRRDYTAIAIVDRWWEQTGFNHATWERVMTERLGVRYLERLPLGTPYTVVAEKVGALMQKCCQGYDCKLVLDATGVGAGFVDMVKEMRRDWGWKLVPVIITSGDVARHEDNYWKVPKKDLMMNLVLKLEQGKLKIAGGMQEGPRLVDELGSMRVRAGSSGRETYGARGEEHDDLVVAVSLACWGAGGRY